MKEKKPKKCGRFRTLYNEFVRDWDKLNLAAKCLVYLAVFTFSATIFISLYNYAPSETGKLIEVMFRSCTASIFGFVMSSNMKKNRETKDRKEIKSNIIKDNDITRDCEKEAEEHNYHDGNIVQIIIATITAFLCEAVILSEYILELNQNVAAISQFRDFMFAGIGYLLGESYIKK